MEVRPYKKEDYQQVESLYRESDLYGGQFDENRDSEERLSQKITDDPEAIFVCEIDGDIIGTVSLIEDGRVAWLFRFAVKKDSNEQEAQRVLSEKALSTLRARGHKQVLVYAPVNDVVFEDRYKTLGFKKGGDYTCYWQDIG